MNKSYRIKIILTALAFTAAASGELIALLCRLDGAALLLWAAICLAALVFTVWLPGKTPGQTRRLRGLQKGLSEMKIFLFSFLVNTAAWIVFLIAAPKPDASDRIVSVTVVVLLMLLWLAAEGVICLAAMLRIQVHSRQLTVLTRVVMIFLWWMPVVNLIALKNTLTAVRNELAFENEQEAMNAVRKEREICKTNYPILLVHGVFFRDLRYFNYWGRVAAELKRNGAVLFYGQQPSAATAEECGAALAARIAEIVAESGCEKVNIIAHSKGGLDARCAISLSGAAQSVASLTTICAPHNGSAAADYLLKKAPAAVKLFVARRYNAAMRKFGDANPDFLRAAQSLTAEACAALNAKTPDAPDVFYQSVMTKMSSAKSASFPLNVTYRIIKKAEGDNDGLVSVASGTRWQCRLIEPQGKQGISHGDVIDLTRKNIPGFSVREVYTDIVIDLKNRGF
ncbi:MAG: triacylglycerol lipase [Oscillospiraceae bacterium]